MYNLQDKSTSNSTIQKGGGSPKENNNNLTRKNIVKIEDKDESYIISQIKDLFYDDSIDSILRNYGLRKIIIEGEDIGLVSDELIEIKSNQIIEVNTIDNIKDLSEDLVRYKTETTKTFDNEESKQYKELEEYDPTMDSGELSEGETFDDELSEEDIDDENFEVLTSSNSLSRENNLDEEGYEFEEIEDGIILEVVQELRESKILFTEMEQEEDIIEEIIRSLPKKKKTDRFELKKILDKVELLKYLKNKYSKSFNSIYDIDDKEYHLLKQEIKIKGRNFKPDIKKYLSNDYSNNIIFPIVSLDSKTYDDIDNNLRKNIIAKKKTGEDIDFIKQLDDLNKIYEKYTKDSQYDYDNKGKEINNLLKSSEPRICDSFYSTNLIQDTNVVENFEDTSKINICRFLGEDIWKDENNIKHTSIEGTNIYINGFMVNKQDEPNDFILRKTKINKYIQPNFYNWNIDDEDIEVNNISSSIFTKDDKVKVCLEEIEVLGTIKSVKKNFIYVNPDDKTLLEKDNQILEFDVESKQLKIDKINEIKNNESYCFNKNKFNVYLFNKDKILLKKKDINNILEQIVPSIYQLIKTETFNNITFNEEINRILMNHGVSYSDLEHSNFKILKSIMDKNIKKIHKNLSKKYEKLNGIKRTYSKIELQVINKNLERDFIFLSNSLLDDINKVYEEYKFRQYSFDNELVRTQWIMNQQDYGKFFAFSIKDKEIKSKKLSEKKTVLLAHKTQLEQESSTLQTRLEEEVRKNDFFQNPNAQCKEGITSKITKIYLSITNLDNDNFKEIMVDPQFKTILEDELVKQGDYCILKDNNNPTISPELVDMNDRIFERIIGEDKRPIWKEKSKGFLADYIREYKKICQEKGTECKFTNSFGPCEPEIIKRLKQNKKDNLEKIEVINRRILEIDEKKKETEIEESLKYYRGRQLLYKKNLEKNILHNKNKMDLFRGSIDLSTERKDSIEIKELAKDILDPSKREDLISLLKERYDIDFLELDNQESIEQTDLGDFNEAGQRIIHHEVFNSGPEELEMTDNEILDVVRSYLVSSTKNEGLNLDDDLDTIQNIIHVFLQIFGIEMNTKTIEFKVLGIFNKSFLTFKEFKKIDKKGKDLESKYNKLKKKNIIFYTTSILLIELQIRLNDYFMSFYEKCISSIDGYPIISKEDEEKVGDRFNYGINFICCILNNLKNGGGFWNSIKGDKKIKKNFKDVLENVLKETDFQNRLHKKRIHIEKKMKESAEIEQNYSWNEFRPYLKKIEQIKEPPDLDINDCKLENKNELIKAIRIADDRNKWYSNKICEKINNIIQLENVENIKYDPLPIGNSCCLDTIDNQYNYYNFLFEKDKDNELKELIKQSGEIEKICKSSSFKLLYIKPSSYKPKLPSFANIIFPKIKDINKEILSLVSTKYIDSGNNIGKKRIFKKYFIKEGDTPVVIDVLTNDNLQDIPNERTEEEFFAMVHNIHERNKIDDPEKIELENNMIQFKILKTVDNFNICFKDSIFMNNTFINDLINIHTETIIKGSYKDVKIIWDKLEVNLKTVKKTFIDNFNTTKVKKEITKIIDNLLNFDKTDEIDTKNFEKDSLELEIYKRKENMIHKYFTNYIKKYVALLANKKIKNMDTEYEFDDYNFLGTFIKSKYINIFKKMRKLTKTLSKFKLLLGFDDINDCNGNIIENSRFNFKNSLKLLELSFILTLDFIINTEESVNSNESLSDNESTSNDEDENLLTNEKTLRINFVKNVLIKIDTNRKKQDMYNSKNNIIEINKLNESNKDRNLYVMQLLDLETRRLRNEQTKAGLVNYADLSKDFTDVLDRDEREQQVRIDLGTDATDEQVTEEARRREVTNYEFSQIETFNTAEGDDEL